MTPPFILREVRLHLYNRGYDIREWRTGDLRRIAGISYQDIYQLEKLGEITPARRDEKGNLVWTPGEVYTLLVEMEVYLREQLEDYGANGLRRVRRKRSFLKLCTRCAKPHAALFYPSK